MNNYYRLYVNETGSLVTEELPDQQDSTHNLDTLVDVSTLTLDDMGLIMRSNS